MYEKLYGLQRRPFSSAPDPDRFSPVASAQRACERLLCCLQRGQGIGILTGAAGLGKTLICRRLLRELNDGLRTIFLPNSGFSTRRSLLQAILYELDHPYIRLGEQELRLELTTALRKLTPGKAGAALIVDEAHLLTDRLLEEIRTITNLIEGGRPLARVLLAGQWPLEEKLADKSLEALSQRIDCHVALEPLSRDESARFLRDCAAWAGGELDRLFTPQAVQLICQAADGVPRCLNQLADHALLLGRADAQSPVDASLVRRALDELKRLPLRWNDLPGEAGEFRLDPPGNCSSTHLDEIHETGSSVPDGGQGRPPFDSAETDPPAYIEVGGDEPLCRSKDEALPTETVEFAGDESERWSSEDDEPSPAETPIRVDYAVPAGDGWISPDEADPAFARDDDSVAAAKRSVLRHPDAGASRPPGTARRVVGPCPSSPGHPTDDAEFEEETVVDYYAALDAGREAPRRDSPHAPNRAHGASGAVSSRPAPLPDPRPDAALDEIAPLLDAAMNPSEESLGNERCCLEAAAVVSRGIAAAERGMAADSFRDSDCDSRSTSPALADLEMQSRLVAATAECAEPLEDRLAVEVLDICRETHHSLIERQESAEDWSDCPPLSSLSEALDEVWPQEFDVVQPEPEADR